MTFARYEQVTCHTCNRSFHPLGIMSHRATHRRKREDCTISYEGRVMTHDFGPRHTPDQEAT